MAFAGLAVGAFAWRGLPAYGPGLVSSLVDLTRPGQPWVTSSTLARWMAGPRSRRPLVLDVRTAEEFGVSHLRGARLLAGGTARLRAGGTPGAVEAAAKKGASDRPVVVYCSLGLRSARAVDALRHGGVSEVYNLRGGIFAWANEGRPLYRDARRVARVHPYNRFWGWLLHR